MFTIRELIETLEELEDEYGNDLPVVVIRQGFSVPINEVSVEDKDYVLDFCGGDEADADERRKALGLPLPPYLVIGDTG